MRRILGVLALIVIATNAIPASAQTTSVIGKVLLVRTGLDADSFAVVINGVPENFINPAQCPIEDGYASIKTAPGYATYYAAALLAFQLQVPVQITVAESGCTSGRPKLIGIDLLPKR